MCSQKSIAFAVTTILGVFTTSQTMFTAYDVTLAIRAQVGHSVNIKHDEVKSEVHAQYRRGILGSDYERTSVNINTPSGLTTALVYHHYSDDAQTYQPSVVPNQIVAQAAQAASTPRINSVAPTLTSGQNQTATSGAKITRHMTNGGTYAIDSRKRVRTPKDLMVKAGFNAGDTVYVLVDKSANRAEVRRYAPTPSVGQTVKALTVDVYNNLLFKPGFSASKFAFAVNRDGLAITAAP
jgi:hypothetical protein